MAYNYPPNNGYPPGPGIGVPAHMQPAGGAPAPAFNTGYEQPAHMRPAHGGTAYTPPSAPGTHTSPLGQPAHMQPAHNRPAHEQPAHNNNNRYNNNKPAHAQPAVPAHERPAAGGGSPHHGGGGGHHHGGGRGGGGGGRGRGKYRVRRRDNRHNNNNNKHNNNNHFDHDQYWIDKKRASMKPVDNYQYRFDPNSTEQFDPNVILSRMGFSNDQVNAAKNEHGKRTLNFLEDDKKVIEHVSFGVFMFFQFIKYAAIIVFIVFICQLVHFIHYARDTDVESNKLAHYFTASYETRTQDLWLGMNIAAMVLFTLGALLYYPLTGALYSSQEEKHERKDAIVRYTPEELNIEVSSHYRSTGDLMCRRIASLFVFLFLIGIMVVVTIFLSQQEENNQGNIGIALAIAIVSLTLNLLYGFLAPKLTEFEKPTYMTHAVRSTTIKLFCFRIANIMAVFGSKSLKADDKVCSYDILGRQFFTIWLLECFVSPFIAIIMSMVWSYAHETYAKIAGVVTGDNASFPNFDLSTEYLRILYKLFLTIAAMTTFPLATGFAILGLFIEFWGAKFRLFKLCGRPHAVGLSGRFVVVVAWILVFVAGVLLPNAGAVWVLSGQVRGSSDWLCSIPTWKNDTDIRGLAEPNV